MTTQFKMNHLRYFKAFEHINKDLVKTKNDLLVKYEKLEFLFESYERVNFSKEEKEEHFRKFLRFQANLNLLEEQEFLKDNFERLSREFKAIGEPLDLTLEDFLKKIDAKNLILNSKKNYNKEATKDFLNKKLERIKKNVPKNEAGMYKKLKKNKKTPLNGDFSSFIEKALNKKLDFSKLPQKDETDLFSVALSIIINLFSKNVKNFTIADFVSKAGRMFLKIFRMSQAQNLDLSSITAKDASKIGTELLFWFKEAQILEEIDQKKEPEFKFLKKSTTTVIIISPKIEIELQYKLFNEDNLPLLDVPKDWELSSYQERIRSKFYVEYNEEKGSFLSLKQEALDVINNLQKVPYKINVSLLNYIIENFDLYLKQEKITIQNYGGLESFVLEKGGEDVFLSKKANWYKQKSLENEYNSQKQKYAVIVEALITAILYQEVDLYFDVFLDWRGRLYFKGFPLNPQGQVLCKNLIKPKNFKHEAHLDVKSSLIQIMLGHLNDPFDKIAATGLKNSRRLGPYKDIYESAVEDVKFELSKLSPKILEIKKRGTDELLFDRSFIKPFIMKFLYSQTYSGMVEEFSEEYSYVTKEIEAILESESKITVVQKKNQITKEFYSKKEILSIPDFPIKKEKKASKEGKKEKNFTGNLTPKYIIPSLITNYMKKQHPELILFRNFFQSLAKYNKDKPFVLTQTRLISATQFYPLKKTVVIPAPKNSRQKTIRLFLDVLPLTVDMKQTIRAVPVNWVHCNDSLIMFYTLQFLQNWGIIAIPTHDSFRVQTSNIYDLNRAYEMAYIKVIENSNLLEKTAEIVLKDLTDEKEKNKIKELLDQIKKYKGLGSAASMHFNKFILQEEKDKVIQVGFLDYLKE